jgi:thiosulfate dehydrogenase [quinone] large subunit
MHTSTEGTMAATRTTHEAHTHKAFADIVRHLTASEPTADTTPRHPAAVAVTAGLTRIALGWVFLWAFLDKTFGLGFATPAESSWLEGGSPTSGFLSHVDGTFAGFFNSMAGQAWADWLFMAGLLGIGVAFMLGIFVNLAAVSGAAMLVLMWAAELPLENNPFMDDHLVYAGVMALLALLGAGRYLGLGAYWERLAIVRKHATLR